MPTTSGEIQYSDIVRIAGQDEQFAADVIDQQGLKRITTESVDCLRIGVLNGTLSVGTSALEIKVGGSRLANRRFIQIYNDSSNTVYLGSSSVTVANGLPIVKNQTAAIQIGDIPIYLIANSSGNTVRIIEGA